jgi:uncharacterized protein involved in oxidation of intracellular sulfur
LRRSLRAAGRPGYYHLDRMLGSAARHGAEVGCCGSCVDARAIDDARLLDGARRSSLEDLTEWTLWADKAITFEFEGSPSEA